MIAMTAIVMMVVMIFSSASVEADPAVLPGTYIGVKWRRNVPRREFISEWPGSLGSLHDERRVSVRCGSPVRFRDESLVLVGF
jgi:hypothetical protein